jgi:hypothetical protein
MTIMAQEQPSIVLYSRVLVFAHPIAAFCLVVYSFFKLSFTFFTCLFILLNSLSKTSVRTTNAQAHTYTHILYSPGARGRVPVPAVLSVLLCADRQRRAARADGLLHHCAIHHWHALRGQGRNLKHGSHGLRPFFGAHHPSPRVNRAP